MATKDAAKKREYLDQIQAAIRFAKKNEWPMCAVMRQYWRVSHIPSDNVQGSEFVTSAVIKPVVEAQISAIVPRNPKMRAVPRKEFFEVEGGKVAAEKTAKLVEKIVDFDLEQTNAREQFKRAARDGKLLGMGCIEIGWDPWIDTSPLVKRSIDATEGSTKQTTETNLRYQEYIRKAAPFLRHRRTEDVLLPAYCQRAEDSPFLVVKNWRLLSEIKADPNYEIKDRENFAGGNSLSWMDDDGRPKPDAEASDSAGYSKLACELHFWHKADDTYAVFIDGVDDPVRWEDTWPFPGGASAIDGFPVKLYIPLPDDGNPYGLPPAQDLIPQQRELTKVRSKMADKVSKWKDITLASDDVNPSEVDKLTRAPEGAIVGVQSTKSYLPLQSKMEAIQALLAYEARIREDIRVQSKVTDYQLAGSPNTNFATDSALLAQSSAASVEDEKVTFRRFMADCAKCMFQLRQSLMPAEESVRITGDRGVEWLSYSKENITGEYDLGTEIEEGLGDRAQARDDARLELEALYGKPEVDGAVVLRDVAKKMRLPEDAIKGTKNFAARREAEYENEMLKVPEFAQIIKPSQEEDLQAHLQSHMEAMQREGEMGMQNPALAQHIQETQAMLQITFGGAGKDGKPQMVNPASGQVRTSGKTNQPSPQARLASGDVGALRGMQ